VPSVVHVVTTDNFAGVERYVCDAASETAARGWETAVVGGSTERMPAELSDRVRWLPGGTPGQALRSLGRIGRQDICHAHMTTAESVSIARRRLNQAPIISTRHFAAPRGASRGGRLLAPWIAKRLERQIAISDFVAQNLERPPDAIVPNGVPPSPFLWQPSSRIVLVLQRLEREKDTITALRAWYESGLFEEGWSLRVVGGGSERAALEAWVEDRRVAGVEFAGATTRVADEFASAGILLAPAKAEPFGLAVVEAMAAGVPVVACASGGHLETVGLLGRDSMFAPGDAATAAAALRSLTSEEKRASVSQAARSLVERAFSITLHVDALLEQYEKARKPAAASTANVPEVSAR
jgi:glycosyltransferase involved in cell wall biosynthesis